MLELLGIKGILGAVGALAAAAFAIYVKHLQRKAKEAEAWKARAASAEREVDSRMSLSAGKARIDAETGAGLAELAREAEAKKQRIDNARSAEEVAEETRRMFGGTSTS